MSTAATPTPPEQKSKDLLGSLTAFLNRWAEKLWTSTPATKEDVLLTEVNDEELPRLMTQNPIVIDLISYLYPKLDLDYRGLWNILRQGYGNIEPNVFLFRADEKVADKFRVQLSSFLKKLKENNALPGPERFRCFFKVDPDIHKWALRSDLRKMVGEGTVTDEQMKFVAQAWDDPEDR